MQVAQKSLGNAGIRARLQSLQQACRLPQQQQQHPSYNRLNRVCSAVAAGGLRSVEDAVAVSIPDVLPTNGLEKAYSTSAQPLPAEIKSVLFSQQQVQAKVAELAAQICKDFKGKPLAIIGVLNGAFIFTSGEAHAGVTTAAVLCCALVRTALWCV
jgi:hypothetical protein